MYLFNPNWLTFSTSLVPDLVAGIPALTGWLDLPDLGGLSGTKGLAEDILDFMG